jgi:hypothetical protein
VAYEFSSTAPAANTTVFKNGDTSRRYVAALYVFDHTSSAEVVIGFRRSRGVVVYDLSGAIDAGVTVSTLQPLQIGNATSGTDVALLMPPTSMMAHLRLDQINISELGKNSYLRTKGTTTYQSFGGVPEASGFNVAFTPILTNTSQVIQYKVDTAATKLNITMVGYAE